MLWGYVNKLPSLRLSNNIYTSQVYFLNWLILSNTHLWRESYTRSHVLGTYSQLSQLNLTGYFLIYKTCKVLKQDYNMSWCVCHNQPISWPIRSGNQHLKNRNNNSRLWNVVRRHVLKLSNSCDKVVKICNCTWIINCGVWDEFEIIWAPCKLRQFSLDELYIFWY